jgi:phosphatidyl-myo-inositol alpha-mannosyltransferase
MRIVQVCPYDIARPGGVQRHIIDTAGALRELGHEVTVIAPRTDVPMAAIPDIEVHRIGATKRLNFSGTGYEIGIALGRDRKALAGLMRDGGFDIAHFHTPWTPFLAPQALSCFSGPTAATFHDTPGDSFSGRMMARAFRGLSRLLLPRFDLLLAPSDAPKGHLVAGAGQEVVSFPPCTDLRPFSAAAPIPGYQDGKLNLLFLGRLEPRKGAILLLQAWQSLSRSGLPLRLIVAGSGPEEEKLKAFVRQHALADVAFVGAPRDTAPWFATADIFCAPAPHGESFGIVLAEAMAAGKPVVAAANAGYRTLLTGEAAQFLAPPYSVEGLAGAIARLARDPGLRTRLGAWGREAALRYDCRRLAPDLVALYQQAIIRHRLRARSAI